MIRANLMPKILLSPRAPISDSKMLFLHIAFVVYMLSIMCCWIVVPGNLLRINVGINVDKKMSSNMRKAKLYSVKCVVS